MQTLVTLLQDNAAMSAFAGIVVAVLFQLLKRVSWLEKFTGSEEATIWKGRVATLIVSLLATIGLTLGAGEWSGIWPALLVTLKTWFVSQGIWAGILRGEKT